MNRPCRADRHLVEVAVAVRELGLRNDLRTFGGLVVHDGDCPHPAGPCDCNPITIEPKAR